MRRICLFVISLLLSFHVGYAQIYDPVKWDFKLEEKGADKADLLFKANVETGWYVYDIDLPEGGPSPTSFTFSEVKGAQLEGKVHASVKPESKYSDLFEMELRFYKKTVTFIQTVKILDKQAFQVAGSLSFMSCDDERCLPPAEVEFEFKNTLLSSTTPPSATTTNEKVEEKPDLQTEEIQPVIPAELPDTMSVIASTASSQVDLWQPMSDELQSYESEPNHSWLYIFISGLIGGFLAFLTPCVWPMIPMTVSFFLKRTKSRKKSIMDTLLYALSIIVIYVALGVIVTLLFGASALNDLATNAIFNIFFFALLVFFAVSFLGAFEIVLPSSWTNKVDRKAETTTGILSLFLMAFTLALVSFSCTGPIIGYLLVEAAVSGSLTGPLVGMFGFALALSIPFAFFAFFPSMMQSMPKSGGWLNVVKVVLGFIELALALKFLSVADLAYHWGILDREVFLVLWIVIFALLGFYLLGKLRFAHDSEVKHISVFRLFTAIVSLSFALYMVPGLWGAPLKAISAFAPPLYTQDFNLYTGEVHPQFKDYEEGMAYAQKHQKPVLIDFTGFGCVNCRNMEAVVWTDPRVKDMIEKDYVLISLYVDDKDPLPKIIEVEEAGKTRKLKTIGDKWSYLQRYKFGANAQPFYVLLDNEGKPIAPSYDYNKDVNKYLDFLKKGLSEYNKQAN